MNRNRARQKSEIPDWRLYERFVASLHSSEASDEVTIIPNAALIGISGIARQIDLLIDSRVEEDVSRRVIVDAKYRKRKIDVNDVEAFEGMMRDCRAHRGIIVATAGFTEGAQRRAQQHIGLRLVPIKELEQLDLTKWERCRGTCISRRPSRKRQGWVLYDQPFELAIGALHRAVLMVGKCDECWNFHIWCWNCGSKFALSDEAEHHCGCKWFWLTALEEEGNDEHGNRLKSVLLLLIIFNPFAILTVDRRPLA